MTDGPICPRCGSDDVFKSRTRSPFERLFSLLVRPCRCLFCGLRFFLPAYKAQPRYGRQDPVDPALFH